MVDTSLYNATTPTYTIAEMDRLVYISKASLRLLRTYTNEIYPNQTSKKTPSESVRLAECIGEIRALLRQILSDSVTPTTKTKGNFIFRKFDMYVAVYQEAELTIDQRNTYFCYAQVTGIHFMMVYGIVP
jgi:hypothetical protein